VEKDSLKSELIPPNFRKIGENYSIFNLSQFHQKFGDASYYRDRMHKGQSDKHSSLYINRCLTLRNKIVLLLNTSEKKCRTGKGCKRKNKVKIIYCRLLLHSVFFVWLPIVT
jgi:hypothetical protein